jgi:quinoprotein glucose dehydrogenase
MNAKQRMLVVLLASLSTVAGCTSIVERNWLAPDYGGWRTYGGTPDQIHYSSLDQINRDNVHLLEVAWSFDTGDGFPESTLQCNPIVVDDVLYAISPRGRIIALDAGTGMLRWQFAPEDEVVPRTRLRGVSYWDGDGKGRILAVVGSYLYALDAATGDLIESFGDGGRRDVREGLGRPAEELTVTATTPGILYDDLLILGSTVPERLPSAPGDVRAYDLRDGSIRWTFHTIPRPGEFGHETWPRNAWAYTGGANSWAGMALDRQRGVVYIPTGSAATDPYGADRLGHNLFANSLIALDADTGERVWHFQVVRHDVWDRDLPAPPMLMQIERHGRSTAAVLQITKSGHVFAFDRSNGTPIYPIEEVAAPSSDVPGEVVSISQPLPTEPPPFARQRFGPDVVTRRMEQVRLAVLEHLQELRYGGQFIPPSVAGTVVFPGLDGGGEWGGGAFDPETGLLYVNANDVPWILRLVEPEAESTPANTNALYASACAGCHGPDGRGSPPDYPALDRLDERYTHEALTRLIRTGTGRMPGFPHFNEQALSALARYLLSGTDEALSVSSPVASPKSPGFQPGPYERFVDPDGYPAVEPPWGTLTAIDVNAARIVWQVPLGEYPELVAQGLPVTGTENYGGPVVTAGGLVFIAATNYDRKFRAFNKTTGDVLWETALPAAGNATPAVYEVDGRQYVVIAAGGRMIAPTGGSFVAFALPENYRGAK